MLKNIEYTKFKALTSKSTDIWPKFSKKTFFFFFSLCTKKFMCFLCMKIVFSPRMKFFVDRQVTQPRIPLATNESLAEAVEKPC